MANFVFIETATIKDKDTQNRIRRQAIRSVQQRKQRQLSSRARDCVQQPQYVPLAPKPLQSSSPSITSDDDVAATVADALERSHAAVVALPPTPRSSASASVSPCRELSLSRARPGFSPGIPPSPSLTGYAALRAEYKIDMADIPANLNRQLASIVANLSRDSPDRIPDLLRGAQGPASPSQSSHSSHSSSDFCSSFYAFLPSRVGENECLDAALRCVMAKTAQQMERREAGGVVSDEKIFRLYRTALKKLRATITEGDAKQGWLGGEVVGSTLLLTLFELLSNHKASTWTQHCRGSTRLIELRGPTGYQTDFDLALLKAQAISITAEAFYQNKHCFFEQPDWQEFFHQMAQREDDDSESLWWSLFGPSTCVAGLYHDFNALLTSNDPFWNSRDTYWSLLERVRNVHTALKNWVTLFSQNQQQQRSISPSTAFQSSLPNSPSSSPCRNTCSHSSSPSGSRAGSGCTPNWGITPYKRPPSIILRGMYTHSALNVTRLLSLLSPTASERSTMESEAQSLATLAMNSARMLLQADPTVERYLLQKYAVPYAVCRTRSAWKEEGPVRLDSRGNPVEPEWEERKAGVRFKWELWCDIWEEQYGCKGRRGEV